MEIDIQETLHTIAEIAVALAGFTGIVIIFGSKGSSWELLRLRTMLRASFSALFCSFVPIVAIQFDFGDIDPWRVSAGIIGGVMAINLVTFWRGRPGDKQSRAQLMSFCGGVIVVAGALLAASGVLANAVLIIIFTLLWQLYVASQNFVLLLVDSFQEST